MININKVVANKIIKNKVDPSYNQLFEKARVNLEIYNADAYFSSSTREMLNLKIK